MLERRRSRVPHEAPADHQVEQHQEHERHEEEYSGHPVDVEARPEGGELREAAVHHCTVRVGHEEVLAHHQHGTVGWRGLGEVSEGLVWVEGI